MTEDTATPEPTRPLLPENWIWRPTPGHAAYDPDDYRETVLGHPPVNDRKRVCKSDWYTAWCQVQGGKVRNFGDVPVEVVVACITDAAQEPA